MQCWSFATDLESHRVGPGFLTGAQRQPEMSPRVTISQYQPSWVLPLGWHGKLVGFETELRPCRAAPGSPRHPYFLGIRRQGSATVPYKSRAKFKAQGNHHILLLPSPKLNQTLAYSRWGPPTRGQRNERHQSPNYTVTGKARQLSAEQLEKQVEPKDKLNPKQKPFLFCFSHRKETFCRAQLDATSFIAKKQ